MTMCKGRESRRTRHTFLLVLLIAALLLPTTSAFAAWVLPPGQESAVLEAVRAAFPSAEQRKVQIAGETVVVNLGALGEASLTRRDDGGLVITACARAESLDVETAQRLLDEAKVAITWVEVGGGAAQGKPTAETGKGAVEKVAGLLAQALDLQRRAGYGRDEMARDALAALEALTPEQRPLWLQLDAALLRRVLGEDGTGRAEAKVLVGRAVATNDGSDRGSMNALAVRALAIAGDDAAAEAQSKAAGGDICQLSALLQRDAVLRKDDALFATAKRLVAAKPDCVGFYPPIAAAVRRSGAIEVGAELFQAGLTARPDDAFVARQLAYIRSRQGDVPQLFALLDKAMAAAEISAVDLVDISHLATTVQAPDAWVAALRAKAEAAPDNLDLAFLLGVVLHYRDDWKASDQWLQRAEVRHGDVPRLLIYRAMNHHRMDQDDLAAPLIEKAAQLRTTDPDVLYCRAVIFLDRAPGQARRDLQAYLEGTAGTADINVGKQARVRQTILDLDGCEGAKSPRACVDQKAMVRLWSPRAAWAGGLVLVLALAWFWRRRSKAAAMALVALAPALLDTGSAWAQAQDRVRVVAGYATWIDPTTAPPRALSAQLSWLDGLDIAQLAIAGALWLAVAAVFFFRVPGAVRAALATLTTAQRRAFAAAWLVGGALRWALPVKLVMVYKGYELVEAAANFLAVPRYGAGSLVLHRAAFAVFPPDHTVVIALHGAASMVSLLLLPLCLAAVLRGRPGASAATVVAVWGLALCPQLIVDARSESILTLGVACIAIAWLLGARWLAAPQGQHHMLDLGGSAAALALAATIRPELIVFGPAVLGLHRWLCPPVEALTRAERWGLTALITGAALLLMPHVAHIASVAKEQVDRGALPGLDLESVLGPLTVPLTRNALWRMAIFPTPWIALLLVWLRRPPDADTRRVSLALAAFATVSTARSPQTCRISRCRACMRRPRRGWSWPWRPPRSRRSLRWTIACAAAPAASLDDDSRRPCSSRWRLQRPCRPRSRGRRRRRRTTKRRCSERCAPRCQRARPAWSGRPMATTHRPASIANTPATSSNRRCATIASCPCERWTKARTCAAAANSTSSSAHAAGCEAQTMRSDAAWSRTVRAR